MKQLLTIVVLAAFAVSVLPCVSYAQEEKKEDPGLLDQLGDLKDVVVEKGGEIKDKGVEYLDKKKKEREAKERAEKEAKEAKQARDARWSSYSKVDIIFAIEAGDGLATIAFLLLGGILLFRFKATHIGIILGSIPAIYALGRFFLVLIAWASGMNMWWSCILYLPVIILIFVFWGEKWAEARAEHGFWRGTFRLLLSLPQIIKEEIEEEAVVPPAVQAQVDAQNKVVTDLYTQVLQNMGGSAADSSDEPQEAECPNAATCGKVIPYVEGKTKMCGYCGTELFPEEEEPASTPTPTPTATATTTPRRGRPKAPVI